MTSIDKENITIFFSYQSLRQTDSATCYINNFFSFLQPIYAVFIAKSRYNQFQFCQ